jgi:hypothetical protein
MQQERGNAILILIVIFLLLYIAGVFSGGEQFLKSFNIRTLLRLDCGITVKEPKPDDHIVFPLEVRGYANKCGWDADATAGTVQAFDEKGFPVSAPTPLTVRAGRNNPPSYFLTMLEVTTPPQTSNGRLVFVSTTGLVHIVPVSFTAEEK